jgi:hypothetical protein
VAGKTGTGYTAGAGTEIAVWLDNETEVHQLTVMEFLPSSSGTADPTMVSPQNPLPVVVESEASNMALETGGNLASIATSSTTIATDIAAVETSTATTATAMGAAGTGISQPTGGSGIIGFLSGIFKALVGGVLAVYNSTPPTLTNGQVNAMQLDSAGNLLVNIKAGAAAGGTSIADGSTFTTGTTPETPVGMLVASTAPTYTAGKVNAPTLDTSGNQFVNVAAGGVQAGTAGTPSADVVTVQGASNMTPIQVASLASGGASYNNAIAPATPAVTSVKGAAGTVLGIRCFNLLSTPVYLKMFDISGAIGLGTSNANYQFMIPGNTGGAGFVVPMPEGRAHANSIKYAVTGGIAVNDDTSITASSVIVDISYN